ncbi:MAG: hypothetical protein R2711_11940 [Acidimicrobiales bacterium]
MLLPGIGLGGLMLAPYIDHQPSRSRGSQVRGVALHRVPDVVRPVLTMIRLVLPRPRAALRLPVDKGLFFEL